MRLSNWARLKGSPVIVVIGVAIMSRNSCVVVSNVQLSGKQQLNVHGSLDATDMQRDGESTCRVAVLVVGCRASSAPRTSIEGQQHGANIEPMT